MALYKYVYYYDYYDYIIKFGFPSQLQHHSQFILQNREQNQKQTALPSCANAKHYSEKQ